ncbi:hypothetical protein [Microcoleus vaginatus]|uniref:hypothetical protein n=1 Tax=Microcoleus vaginatus TaxID=119532 RepID=UPI0032A303BC
MSFGQAPQRLHPLSLSIQEVVCLKAQMLMKRKERLGEHYCYYERSPLNVAILFVRSHLS